eukprot:scaffold25738_cov110-Skeletonema_marinoi.AAC.1
MLSNIQCKKRIDLQYAQKLCRDNPYIQFDVSENAGTKEIGSGFRKMSMLCHPDKPNGSTSAFQKIAASKNVLLDEHSRRQMDRILHDAKKKVRADEAAKSSKLGETNAKMREEANSTGAKAKAGAPDDNDTKPSSKPPRGQAVTTQKSKTADTTTQKASNADELVIGGEKKKARLSDKSAVGDNTKPPAKHDRHKTSSKVGGLERTANTQQSKPKTKKNETSSKGAKAKAGAPDDNDIKPSSKPPRGQAVTAQKSKPTS